MRGFKNLVHFEAMNTSDLVEQIERIKTEAVLLQARADALADAHCDQQFFEVSEDLRAISRRLERIAATVRPKN